MKVGWFDWVGMFGSIASFLGVVFAIWQIMKTKKAAQAAKDASIIAIDSLNRELSISHIAKHIEILNLLRNYIINSKLELAECKMQEVKEFLIELMQNPHVKNHFEEDDANYQFTHINTDIRNIQEVLIGAKSNTTLKINIIVNHLDKIGNFLKKVETHLKYEHRYV